MRLILLLLLASGFGYGLLQIDKIDPNNYVKMYVAGYSVEVKVLGFLLLLIGIVMVLYFSLWLFRVLWRSPKVFFKWRNQRNHDQAEQQLGAGYLSLIKGDWHKAESQLLSKTAHSGVPYVNYLGAAQAAQQQGRLEKRDEYLSAAYKLAPKERLAIGLTKAKLHQQAGQMEQALATLDDVSSEGKKNPQFTAMLLQTYEQTQDWQGALNILPMAKKQKALSSDALKSIQSKIYANSLSSADDVDAAWQALPRNEKKQVQNIEFYAKALSKKGEASAAEKLIRATLKTSWSDELVRIYGKLTGENTTKLLRRVEGWLMARPENAELNLAAGRFAMAEKNNDAAKDYLQKAINLSQLPAAYALLGEVFEANNESGKALQLYRTGMQSLSQGTNHLIAGNDIGSTVSNDVREGELVSAQS